MIGTPRALDIGGTSISVIDYGGSGTDVLLVHSPGYCAPAWESVAKVLDGRVRAWSLDLPGHGHSEGTLTGAAEARAVIAEVARRLELDRPVLAGLELAGYYAMAVAAEHPALARAVVSVGASLIRERGQTEDLLAFAASADVGAGLTERFYFGTTGRGAADRAALVDSLVDKATQDWLLSDIEPGLRTEVEWSMRDLPDGSWIHLPRVESAQGGYEVAPDDPYYPDVTLYGRVPVPTWVVLSRGSTDDEVIEESKQLARDHEHLTCVGIIGGLGPHYQTPEGLADVILTAAAVP